MKNSWGAARRKGITLPSLYVTSALALVLAAGMSQIAMAKDSSVTGSFTDDVTGGNAVESYGVMIGMSDTGIVLFEYKDDNGDWYYASYSLTDGFTDLGSEANISLNAISADGSTIVGGYYVTGDYTGFVWSAADGYTDIGTLGGSYSYAADVSDDGSAVTGWSTTSSGAYHAFYWTAEGIVDIGTLGGNDSAAYAISGDGSTVVGYSLVASGYGTAFRWDNVSQTIESLGTLGITYSYATLVSYDGSVVAGYSITTDNHSYTFRWTEEGGMTNIGTLGGTYTYVSAMSDDGGAIVGRSSTTSDSYFHAYRWFVSGDGITGTMSDLGTLGGGNTSAADDVSADGKVVVGTAWDSASVSHGFRWTDETGMISVDDWLRDAGVTLDTDITSGAKYVSADGNIVTGFTQDGLIYIAKVSVDEETDTDTDTDGDDDGSGSSGGDNSGSGIITYDDFLPTLYGVQVTSPALAQASTVMFGAQGSPMRNLLSLGQKSVWGTVDSGFDNGPSSDGGLALGDFGMGYGIADGVTARLSVGATYTRQDLDDGGEFRNRGYYVAPEVSALLGDNVYLTVGGYASRGSADVNRGYRNGTALDYSSGSTDTKTYGLKARLDWLDAASINGTAITPYAAISRAWSHADAYRESGGSFPVSYDAVDDHQTIIRLGSDFIHPLTNDFRLTFRAEADYRFEKRAADISGEIIDVSSFDLTGAEQKRFWLRGGIGGEYDVAGGTASLMLNVTTEGSDPDIWLRAGWQTKF